LIQNNVIRSSGAKLPRCLPIGCRVGNVSSAALRQIRVPLSYKKKSEGKTNGRRR
jgi:hypothetical protein